MGGYADTFSSILAPLGRNNLLVLAALLLLHYFAVKNSKKEKKEIIKKTDKKGGFAQVGSILSNLLAPLGVNAFGSGGAGMFGSGGVDSFLITKLLEQYSSKK
jgi:asparagine synthetase B (glutamine-hydrolysing)